MTWTKTGTDTYLGSSRTSGQTSATLSAGTVGDLRVIEFLTCASTVSVSSLSGGGVTTWTRAGSVNVVASTTIGVAANAEIWYGKITSSGTALTIAYSGTVGSTSCRLMQRDYRTNRSGTPTYSVSSTGFLQTSGHTSSSPLTWPSLTTKGSGELVVGVMGNFGTMSAPSGASTGYTYTTDTDANYHIYRLTCAAAEAEAPTLTFTGSDGWYAMDAIFDDGLSAPGSASATGAAQRVGSNATQNAGSASATAAAQRAGSNVTANAGSASATAAGFPITFGLGQNPPGASATGSAKQAGANVVQNAGSASATAAAKQAGSTVTQNTGSASATAAAQPATPTAGQNVGSASATATAQPAEPMAAPGPGTASATAMAFGATAIIGVAPLVGSRIYLVPAESRNVLADPDVRSYLVDPESRTVTVSVSDEETGV